ncbi:aminopeptidase P family protein [Marinobacterium lutimaris]|uniref:Creatinase n=1 Tax=Marinobacterium lutimaris TaxID=568106 RepID=A0A1H6B7F4_9GAMM|nr:aminopeptidase P family protein [Marinobacterium lutimaris]SEG56147.1 creatinase [Marinobacterium lutimaris]
MFADLTEIRAGVKSRAAFSAEEMFRRLSVVRELMNEQGLDALLLTQAPSIAYYSNLVPTSVQQPTLLILTPERSVTLSPISEGGHAYRYSFGDSLVYRDAAHLFGTLRRLIPSVRQIGIESWDFSSALEAGLREVLPQLKHLHPLEQQLLALRTRRSVEEVQLLRRVAALGRLGYDTFTQALSDGLAEYTLAEVTRGAMLDEAAIYYPHLEISDISVLVQSGNNTDGRFNPPGARWIQPGDILNLCCLPALAGYRLHSARTFFLGYCEDEQLRLWDINCAAHRRAVELVAPGIKPADVSAELDTLYRRFDLSNQGTRDYLQLFGECALASGSEFAQRPLEAGMVLTLTTELLLPDTSLGGVGYREVSQLLVTENGCELLTDLPLGAASNRIATIQGSAGRDSRYGVESFG